MHPPSRPTDLQSPQRTSVETCRQTSHDENVVENWSWRLIQERDHHTGRPSCNGHGLNPPRTLPVSRPVIHAHRGEHHRKDGMAEPACRRPASAPGTSARPVSWRGSSPGPISATMCVGAPGEARKCAVCKNELFRSIFQPLTQRAYAAFFLQVFEWCRLRATSSFRPIYFQSGSIL